MEESAEELILIEEDYESFIEYNNAVFTSIGQELINRNITYQTDRGNTQRSYEYKTLIRGKDITVTITLDDYRQFIDISFEYEGNGLTPAGNKIDDYRTNPSKCLIYGTFAESGSITCLYHCYCFKSVFSRIILGEFLDKLEFTLGS